MIDRNYGSTTLICDCCGEEVECEDFQDALDKAHSNGWTTTFTCEWTNLCPNCIILIKGMCK